MTYTVLLQQVTGKCEALYDFTADNTGELKFTKGDIILTSGWVNDEWMEGEIGGRNGIFPVSYVKILVDLPKTKSKQGKWAWKGKFFSPVAHVCMI